MNNKEHMDMLAKYIKEATDEGEQNIYKELMKEVLLQPKKGEEDSTIAKIEKVQEVDPVEQQKNNRLQEEALMTKVKESLELEHFIKNMDTDYKTLIKNNSALQDINNADMGDNHKAVRKVKLVLKDKDNYSLIPHSQRVLADKILSTNQTEEVDLDLKEAQLLMKDIYGIQKDRKLHDLKSNPLNTKGSNEQSVVEKAFMRDNIFNTAQ